MAIGGGDGSDVEEVLDRHLRPFVSSAAFPGLVAMLAMNGRVWEIALGAKAFGSAAPMRRDDLFRIASISKPVAAACLLTMVDEGRLRLDDPVDRWLPELADRRVLRAPDAELHDTEPVRGPILVEHLLTSTMGFGIGGTPSDSTPVQLAERDLELRTLRAPWPPSHLTNDEWIGRLGSLPLMHHPGEGWRYHSSNQVLGVLLERVDGRPVHEVLRTRLFDPLDMVDSGLVVAAAEAHRLPTAYEPDPATGALGVLDDPADSHWLDPTCTPNVAGWMVSTLDDLARFTAMLEAGGLHGDRRILAERTVRTMTSDRLSPRQRADAVGMLDDSGWGHGLATPRPGGDRWYGWTGGTGVTWRTDVDTGVTGILLTQRAPDRDGLPPIFPALYAAMAEVAGRVTRPAGS